MEQTNLTALTFDDTYPHGLRGKLPVIYPLEVFTNSKQRVDNKQHISSVHHQISLLRL